MTVKIQIKSSNKSERMKNCQRVKILDAPTLPTCGGTMKVKTTKHV